MRIPGITSCALNPGPELNVRRKFRSPAATLKPPPNLGKPHTLAPAQRESLQVAIIARPLENRPDQPPAGHKRHNTTRANPLTRHRRGLVPSTLHRAIPPAKALHSASSYPPAPPACQPALHNRWNVGVRARARDPGRNVCSHPTLADRWSVAALTALVSSRRVSHMPTSWCRRRRKKGGHHDDSASPRHATAADGFSTFAPHSSRLRPHSFAPLSLLRRPSSPPPERKRALPSPRWSRGLGSRLRLDQRQPRSPNLPFSKTVVIINEITIQVQINQLRNFRAPNSKQLITKSASSKILSSEVTVWLRLRREIKSVSLVEVRVRVTMVSRESNRRRKMRLSGW